MKLIARLLLVAGIAGMITSCLDIDQPEQVTNTPEQEMALLNEYIDTLVNRGYDVDTTDLGIYYITLEEGEGDFPEAGDTLDVVYTGFFIGGQVFDASQFHYTDGIYSFVLGEQPMITGWDNGMAVINKNAKVLLIIPSEFAYGAGNMSIPPYTTLVFEIEMKDIKPS